MNVPSLGLLRILAMDAVWALWKGEPKIITDAREAGRWAASTLSQTGYDLDFSVASLREVDRFFDDQMVRGRIMLGSDLGRNPGRFIFALGSYVGEVVRRAGNGVWAGEWLDPLGMKLEVRLAKGDRIWPIQRVYARFRSGPEDGIYVYGMSVLGLLKEVSLDDIRRRDPDGAGDSEAEE